MQSLIGSIPKWLPVPDAYDLKARIFPALIVMMPIIPAASVQAVFHKLSTGMVGSIFALAVLYLLTRIARDQGKRIEPRLFKKWGGIPSSILLRHANDQIDDLTKNRYKKTIESLSGVKLPTSTEEQADPAKADLAYGSGIQALKEQRRDKLKYPLVFQENCNYGFMRNLLGLKKLGLGIAVAALAIDVFSWLYIEPRPANPIFLSLAITAGVGLYLLALGPNAVRRTADAYAMALLRTCEPNHGSVKKPRTKKP